MKNKHRSKTADVNPNSNIVTATAAWRAQNQTGRGAGKPWVRAGRQSQLLLGVHVTLFLASTSIQTSWTRVYKSAVCWGGGAYERKIYVDFHFKFIVICKCNNNDDNVIRVLHSGGACQHTFHCMLYSYNSECAKWRRLNLQRSGWSQGCGPESSRGPLLTRPLSVQVIPNKNEENRYFWECFVCFHFKYFITRLNFFIHTWVVSVWQEAALLLSLCSCLNQATHEFVSLSLLSAHKELILTLKSTTKQPCRFLTQHSVHTEASLQSQWT